MAWSFERILSFVRGPYWFPCCVAVFVVSLQAHLPYGHFRLLKFVARKVSLPCSSTKLLPPFLALASARLENESTSRDSERIDLRFFFLLLFENNNNKNNNFERKTCTSLRTGTHCKLSEESSSRRRFECLLKDRENVSSR